MADGAAASDMTCGHQQQQQQQWSTGSTTSAEDDDDEQLAGAAEETWNGDSGEDLATICGSSFDNDNEDETNSATVDKTTLVNT